MNLTSKQAIELLESAKGKTESDGWIYHSICVGNTAGKIAEALNKNGYELDVEKATTLGYIHDIGKMVGPFKKKEYFDGLLGYNLYDLFPEIKENL